MLKYNCSENTKFPNLKFTCKGDKDKFAGITLVLIVLPLQKKSFHVPREAGKWELLYIKWPLLKGLSTSNTTFLLDEANLTIIEVLQTW